MSHNAAQWSQLAVCLPDPSTSGELLEEVQEPVGALDHVFHMIGNFFQ